MKVSIIGLGLIGGSFSLALKKRLEEVEVVGWDNDPAHLQEAKALGIIDQMADTLPDIKRLI